MAKRDVDLVVLSDVHLGTYGSHANELLSYLKSINPKALILNGDIIDIWQFSKSYWPESHTKVLRRIMKLVAEGVPVYYITGNHDEMLRKYADLELGTFKLINKLVLELDGKKAWFFHGDIFDVTMQHSKWLARLGAIGYDTLILINSFVNWCLQMAGREKLSFSKRIKAKFKDAVKFMNDFENTAADLAVEKGYDFVVCGHIHQAEKRRISSGDRSVLYLNSGDWVESLTALEYNCGSWNIFKYQKDKCVLEDHSEADTYDSEDLKSKLDMQFLYAHFVKESV